MKLYIKIIDQDTIEIKTRKNSRTNYWMKFYNFTPEEATAFTKEEEQNHYFASVSDEYYPAKKLIHIENNMYYTLTYNGRIGVSQEIGNINLYADEEDDMSKEITHELMSVVHEGLKFHSLRVFV